MYRKNVMQTASSLYLCTVNCFNVFFISVLFNGMFITFFQMSMDEALSCGRCLHFRREHKAFFWNKVASNTVMQMQNLAFIGSQGNLTQPPFCME